MPVIIPDNLPASGILESENIFVMNHFRAFHQDIRPLRIIILNLMPNKAETEVQLLRLLGNSPLQLDIELLHPATHKSKNTPIDYLMEFYTTFESVKNNKYDGLIITGAPVEKKEFEDVDYWEELCDIMEWSKENVFSTLHICWGAQAGLYYHYDVPKYEYDKKLSGIFSHKIIQQNSPLTRGFNDEFEMPHSRYTYVKEEDIINKRLSVLAISDEAGPAIIANKGGRQIFVTGHFEYTKNTLKDEYLRDVKNNLNPDIPKNYFKNDNPNENPVMSWKSHAFLLFMNWLNYYVYQTTPYDIFAI